MTTLPVALGNRSYKMNFTLPVQVIDVEVKELKYLLLIKYSNGIWIQMYECFDLGQNVNTYLQWKLAYDASTSWTTCLLSVLPLLYCHSRLNTLCSINLFTLSTNWRELRKSTLIHLEKFVKLGFAEMEIDDPIYLRNVLARPDCNDNYGWHLTLLENGHWINWKYIAHFDKYWSTLPT